MKGNKLRIDLRFAVLFMVVGYFFINLSLLEPATRQLLAFSFFGLSMFFSIKEIASDIFRTGRVKSILVGLTILFYCYFVFETLGAYGEYGNNKYIYLLFIVTIGFITFPPILKYEITLELFCRYFFYLSIIFCFFAIFYSNPDEGRRSEMGLNPAILARICMIAGIYITTVIYFKGFTLLRGFIVILSIAAVFFTATKTPVPVFIVSFYFVSLKKVSLKQVLSILKYGVIVIIAGLLLLLYVVPESYSKRILNPEGLSVEEQSVEGNRLDLYQKAFEVIPDNPGGIGYGGFAKYSFIVVPHNIYLEIAIEFGVLAAVLFFLWSIAVIVKIKKMKLDTIPMMFFSVLYVYFFISFLFGGELTIQALLFYLSGSTILYFMPYNRRISTKPIENITSQI